VTLGLKIDHCPGCGKVFQKNFRYLCADCAAREDELTQSIERHLKRNRFLNNEQLAEATGLSPNQIRSRIREGKLKLYDYPNLSDACDCCGQPIRRGKICGKCTVRLQEEIRHEYEQDRLMKERRRAANSYIYRN